jgi:hypothetical protein
LRSAAIDDGGNDGIAVDAEAGEVGYVDHGADASDWDMCFRFVSIGYVRWIIFLDGPTYLGKILVGSKKKKARYST